MVSLPLLEKLLILPAAFPRAVSQPKFQLGDRVQWQPKPTRDFGIITGIQYAPAPHLHAWAWQYVIWLDADSPSCTWVITDTAWEADLEAIPIANEAGGNR